MSPFFFLEFFQWNFSIGSFPLFHSTPLGVVEWNMERAGAEPTERGGQ